MTLKEKIEIMKRVLKQLHDPSIASGAEDYLVIRSLSPTMPPPKAEPTV